MLMIIVDNCESDSDQWLWLSIAMTIIVIIWFWPMTFGWVKKYQRNLFDHSHPLFPGRVLGMALARWLELFACGHSWGLCPQFSGQNYKDFFHVSEALKDKNNHNEALPGFALLCCRSWAGHRAGGCRRPLGHWDTGMEGLVPFSFHAIYLFAQSHWNFWKLGWRSFGFRLAWNLNILDTSDTSWFLGNPMSCRSPTPLLACELFPHLFGKELRRCHRLPATKIGQFPRRPQQSLPTPLQHSETVNTHILPESCSHPEIASNEHCVWWQWSEKRN